MQNYETPSERRWEEEVRNVTGASTIALVRRDGETLRLVPIRSL